jgi:hypothetical protein
MDNSMCHNEHRVVDELGRLKILRASHPSDSLDISPCDFWRFGNFKEKENRRTVISKARKTFSGHVKNCEITSLLRSFKWYLNHGEIGCAGLLNMTETTLVNDIFAIRLFHGQITIGVRSHYFSATLYVLHAWAFKKPQTQNFSQNSRLDRPDEDFSTRDANQRHSLSSQNPHAPLADHRPALPPNEVWRFQAIWSGFIQRLEWASETNSEKPPFVPMIASASCGWRVILPFSICRRFAKSRAVDRRSISDIFREESGRAGPRDHMPWIR